MDTASKTTNSCHYSKGKTTSFSLLLLPTPNGMGRRRFHAAFILYKTLGYPELRYKYDPAQRVDSFIYHNEKEFQTSKSSKWQRGRRIVSYLTDIFDTIQ